MIVPLTPISRSCLAYPLKRAGHALPAQSPGLVTLGRLPLGQPPSLHRLLSLRLGLVRRLRRYNGSVRASLDFPMRSVVSSLTDSHGLSRLPLKALACMLRVSDRARSKSVSPLRRLQFCLPLSSTASAPRKWPPLARWWFNFAAPYLACTYPCQRFTLTLADENA
jgi:hypothetical protein